DEDSNEYIDYVGSWGPMILGHAHPAIVEAVQRTASDGTSFGAATEREVAMAELIKSMMPSIEMVRMVNSGTEATMSAIRLARAYTKCSKIIKFDGCYHGHADSFLIKAGSGVATLGIPDSPGVTQSVAAQTLTAEFNNIASVKALIEHNRGEVAAVIVEPVVGNMGCIPPQKDFLTALRALCTQEKILLIFDEVMTGFRVASGGAQQLYNIIPDLTTLGKIIGGGLPVGAYGGKKDIMQHIAPSGPVYQAGTLSGNPLAMAAGMALLNILKHDQTIYSKLEQRGATFEAGLLRITKNKNLPISINRIGSMLTLFFTDKSVSNAEEARRCDTKRFGEYFRSMLKQGVYLPPSQFEAAFVSAAHTPEDIEMTISSLIRQTYPKDKLEILMAVEPDDFSVQDYVKESINNLSLAGISS
ncbi:MAG: glutamate-1-semialdehyde 2,1-aminomutase, partial [Ignavibacteriales bacterium]|nr:glutamate-1-semialdehyde 2,1-aminomutase [Ignavibacteriales bacterium]